MICPHGTHAVSFRALHQQGNWGFSYYSCPPLPASSRAATEHRKCFPNAAAMKWGQGSRRTKRGREETWRWWGCGRNGWGRIQSPEIRLMYYDISLCAQVTRAETPHSHRTHLETFSDVGSGKEIGTEMKRGASQWWSMLRVHVLSVYKPCFGIGNSPWF